MKHSKWLKYSYKHNLLILEYLTLVTNFFWKFVLIRYILFTWIVLCNTGNNTRTGDLYTMAWVLNIIYRIYLNCKINLHFIFSILSINTFVKRFDFLGILSCHQLSLIYHPFWLSTRSLNNSYHKFLEYSAFFHFFTFTSSWFA